VHFHSPAASRNPLSENQAPGAMDQYLRAQLASGPMGECVVSAVSGSHDEAMGAEDAACKGMQVDSDTASDSTRISAPTGSGNEAGSARQSPDQSMVDEDEDEDLDGPDDEDCNDESSNQVSSGKGQDGQQTQCALNVPVVEPQEPAARRANIVRALAKVLTQLTVLDCRPKRLTPFHSVRAPQLSIHEYLNRIATYFMCSDECLVLGLVYIDRVMKWRPEFGINCLSIHRVLVTSVMLAAKYFDDVWYSNLHYAKVGGLRVQELNALESRFLAMVNWRLYVSPEEYNQYLSSVLMAVSGADPYPMGRSSTGANEGEHGSRAQQS